MLASIGKYILSILIDKGLKALVDCIKYLVEKSKRNSKLSENKKNLSEAVKNKDDEALKNASENSLNND
jgi:hypothetical protein